MFKLAREKEKKKELFKVLLQVKIFNKIKKLIKFATKSIMTQSSKERKKILD